MMKFLLKTAVILLLLLAGVSFYLPSDMISIKAGDAVYQFSLSAITVGLFCCFLLGQLLFCGFQWVVNVLKKDVLYSNHSFQASKNTDSAPLSDQTNKIILSRNQFDEAAILIVKTMSAITAGVMKEARRHLVHLRKIIGDDAVVDILMMKIYKGEKNFDKMEQLSKKLMQNEDIQLVGMKAALEAQMQKKEFTEALKTVNQAFEVRHDLYWVIGSAFLLRAQNNDWFGALEVLEAGIEKNIIPVSKAKRLKAVALYELAKQAQEEKDNTNFFRFITQALEENNKLIPAALDLAQYYIKTDGQKRKAEKVLYSMWVENPSYEIAEAYLKLFKNDTCAEKIQRMEKLALANSKLPSLNNLILAELYIAAKKYEKARIECKIFLLKNPATKKIAGMLQFMAAKKHKNKNDNQSFVKSLAQRFIHTDTASLDDFPEDFQWICANCGHTADEWSPICPSCGEIGRNYWHLYVDKEASNIEEI